jgi:hypothetical protein
LVRLKPAQKEWIGQVAEQLPWPLRERFLKHLGDLLRPLLDVTDVAVELALGEARRRLGERGRCGTPEPNYFIG